MIAPDLTWMNATKILKSGLLFLALMTCASPAFAASTDTIHQAVFERVLGKVEIQTKGKGAWRPARVGGKVGSDDRIRTAAASSARIVIGDVGAIEFGEQSEARFGTLRQVREPKGVRDVVVVHLERGLSQQAFRRFPGRTGEYRVATPIAVAGVRGTRFEMELDDQLSNLGVAVAEGSVELNGTSKGQNWSRMVSAGNQIRIAAGELPPQAMPADSGELEEVISLDGAGDRTASRPGAQGDAENSSETSSVSVPVSTNPTSVKISFGSASGDPAIDLEVGKDFSFKQKFSSLPFVLEASGRVSAAGGKAIIRFLSLKAVFAEGAAREVTKIPCTITATAQQAATPQAAPGGAESFQIKVLADGEVEIE